MSATDVFARRATLSRSVRLLSEFRFEQTRPGPVLHRTRRGHRRDGRRPVAGDSSASPRRAGRCSTSAAGPATSRRPSKTPGSATSASSPTPPRCMRAPRPAGRQPTSAPPAWRCRSPTPAWTSACRPMSPSTCREPWRLAREMLRVTRPGGLAVLSYTVWLGPFGGHEMGLTPLPRRRPRRRPLRPQARPSAEEQLRIVTVRGLRRGRPRLRREHRRAGRRIPPLPPTMGVVDDQGPAAQGVPGEQSGAGPPAAAIARLKHVLVLADRG